MGIATTIFLSLFITLAFVPIFRGVALHAHILDIPDGRKVHTKPIPKIGGLAMSLGFFIPILFWLPLDSFVVGTLLGAAILVAAGFVDDVIVLGYKPKFMAQIVAGLVVVLYGGVRISNLGSLLPEGMTLPMMISLPLTLLLIVGITNAINLADGLDGLAGGMVLMTFLCMGIIAYTISDSIVLIMSLALLGALFGFLSFNTYPASIFMGDAGSQFLGFLSIVLSLKLTQGNPALCPVMPLLIIGLPVIDTLIVMSERVGSGRSPFVADNKHFHHKLLGMGLFHTEAVFVYYILQSVFVLSAYLFRFYSDWFVVAFYLALFSLIVMFAYITTLYDFRFRRYELIDKMIKGKLSILKDKKKLIIISSLILYTLPPGLLISGSFQVKGISPYAYLIALLPVPLILFFWIRRVKIVGTIIRTVLYFLIPFVIYFGQGQPDYFRGVNLDLWYLAAYFTCIFSALVILRLDRQQNKFQGSPMDFLIIITVLCVFPLLSTLMDLQKTSMLLVQILIFFYTYEIMLNERHMGQNVVIVTTIISLLIIGLKGFFV